MSTIKHKEFVKNYIATQKLMERGKCRLTAIGGNKTISTGNENRVADNSSTEWMNERWGPYSQPASRLQISKSKQHLSQKSSPTMLVVTSDVTLCCHRHSRDHNQSYTVKDKSSPGRNWRNQEQTSFLCSYEATLPFNNGPRDKATTSGVWTPLYNYGWRDASL